MSSTIPARPSRHGGRAWSSGAAEEEALAEPPEMSFACPHCGTANTPERKFCARCGKSLREPCGSCGELNTAGERFCGTCGADLDAALQKESDRCESALHEAQRLHAAGQLDEAIGLLATVAKNKHPRLAERVGRARQLLAKLSDERNRRRSGAADAFADAQQHLSTQHYQPAVQLLEGVVPSLRTAAMNQLLEDARNRLAEIARLSGELHEALRAKSFEGLLPKVARLLTLKPDNAQARQVARRLQERLCQAAQSKLAAYQYDEALKLLDQVPDSIRTAPTVELYERVDEVAWMARDLRTAPVVDAALLAVAQRLAKTVPGDQRVGKVVAELRRRAEAGPPFPRSAVVPWAAAPEQSTVGLPLDWRTGFERICWDDAFDATVLKQHPGCFFVACGLALQGLGQAQLPLNLLPRQDLTAFAKATRLMCTRYGSIRTAWGVDLGTNALKAIKLRWHGRGQSASIEAAAHQEHRKPLSQAANEAEARVLLSESLKAFVSQHKTRADRLCVSLPARLTLSRQFQVPRAAHAKLRRLVEHEARRHMPLDPKKVLWDYQVLDDFHAPCDKQPATKNGADVANGCQVLVMMTKHGEISRIFDTLRQAGLRVDAIQSDALAVHNFLVYDHFSVTRHNESSPAGSRAAVAAVDVGNDSSKVVVSSPRLVWSGTLGFGGQSFTRALVTGSQLALVQAEKFKRNPAEAPRLSQLYQTLGPMFDDFAHELRLVLDSYANVYPDHPVERILACGGGLQLHGLLSHLRFG